MIHAAYTKQLEKGFVVILLADVTVTRMGRYGLFGKYLHLLGI